MMLRPLAALALAILPATAQAADHCAPDPAAFRALRERVLRPPPGQVVVVAHRGCFAAEPENSPEAILACWRMGVEVVENDVRATRDGELVVVHDDTVDRVTNGWGYLEDLTMAEITRLRVREREGGAAALVTDLPVPTLRAYFRAAKHRVMINLELKPSAGASWQALLDKSIAIAREEGVVDQILLKVPDVRNHGKTSRTHLLETVKVPDGVAVMPIIWQSDAPAAARLDQLERFKPVGYEVPFQSLDYFKQVARDPRLAGRPLMAVAVRPYWSAGLDDARAMADPDANWGRLVASGANYVMTDRAEALVRYLARKGMRPAPELRCTG